jgi:hypothetical protein
MATAPGLLVHRSRDLTKLAGWSGRTTQIWANQGRLRHPQGLTGMSCIRALLWMGCRATGMSSWSSAGAIKPSSRLSVSMYEHQQSHSTLHAPCLGWSSFGSSMSSRCSGHLQRSGGVGVPRTVTPKAQSKPPHGSGSIRVLLARYEECSLIFSVLRMRMEDTGKVCCVYMETWRRYPRGQVRCDCASAQASRTGHVC